MRFDPSHRWINLDASFRQHWYDDDTRQMTDADYERLRQAVDAALQSLEGEMLLLDVQPFNLDVQRRYDELNDRLNDTIQQLIAIRKSRSTATTPKA